MNFETKNGGVGSDDPHEKTIIAGLCARIFDDDHQSDDVSMDELAALVETAGGEVMARVMQNRSAPDPHTFIGEGKAAEIKELAKSLDAGLVVFDNELSPSQVKALEEETDCRIIDRSGIILDIFAGRAKTAEGKLQVELAQYKYLLPRLFGRGLALSQQTASGGKSPIGTRGPGETKLETDRRHIRARVNRLEDELKELQRIRAEQRRKREKNGIPIVSIIGYTNAGKSTLLNTLTGAGIEANNRLFDTLDPTTRRLEITDTLEVLLTDTVGFIRRLPHHLIEAFKATLEELSYADLVLHVVDLSNPEWQTQARVADELADKLCAPGVPKLYLFNKCDLCAPEDLPAGDDIICISAKTGKNISELLSEIAKQLDTGRKKALLHLPYSKSAVLDTLYRDAKVESVEYEQEYIRVAAICDPKVYGRVREYDAEAAENA